MGTDAGVVALCLSFMCLCCWFGGARLDLRMAQRSSGSSYPLQTLLKLQLWTQLLGELLPLSFLLWQSLKIIPDAGKSRIDEEQSGFKAG